MSVFLVTWDLNRAKPNYGAAREAFLKQLAAYDMIKDQGLDSVCFVSTLSTANQVSAHLQLRLDSNDRLVVTRLRAAEHQGWLNPTIWEWINTRL